MATKTQVKAALDTVFALAEAIRSLKQVPSGVLYAQVMPHMDFDCYMKAVEMLKRTGLVEEDMHVLRWVDPQPAAKEATV